jgi:uncharacterized protein (TIGR00255 family)
VRGDWDVPTLMRVPGVFVATEKRHVFDEAERAAVDRALEAALAALDAERQREGHALQADLIDRIGRMDALVAAVRARAASIPAAMLKRITERVGQLLSQIPLDPARLAQEAAILADRADVAEELVRLAGHLAQARALLADGGAEPVGKRMDFLLQEIHRETNTIASKSADLEISRMTLDLKSESERVREQIQNLE